MQLFLRFTVFFTWVFLAVLTHAQPYVEGGHTRHRFAQMTMGAEFLYTPASGQTSLLMDGAAQAYQLPASLRPRLSIGGTHFWGHAEFYVAFALGNMLDNQVGADGQVFSSPGVETAFKLYPWRIQRGRISPFVGSGMSSTSYGQRQGDQRGPYLNQTIVPLTGGLTFQTGNLLLEVGARYETGKSQTYYLSRTQTAPLERPKMGLFVGMRWMLETTLSAEKPYQDGRTEALIQSMREKGTLNGFSLAVGPSAGFTLGSGRSTYNDGERAFVGEHKGSGVFVDLGLGYYHHDLDAHLNLAYRSYRDVVSAYDFGQVVRRRALTLEGYKYLFDFHGFVPFVGPSISLENWRLRDIESRSLVYEQSERKVLPGLTFGWDIRPNRAQSFILRTNLRYTPYVMQTPGNTHLFLHQLEFNFIQLVIYPSRWQVWQKLRK